MPYRATYCFLALYALTFCLATSAMADSPKLVIYPGNAPRYAEYIELLRTALDRTSKDYGPYRMQPAAQEMNDTRFIVEARAGKLINVIWTATSKENEKNLIPIRIPLGKGILGYRIGFIRAGAQQRFDNVRTINDLQSFEFGLGPSWGDIGIYQAAGFKIRLAPYEDLFPMTSIGRFDYFSRGINEVFSEFEAHKSKLPNLAIEQQLLLHYPFPFYFFVSPTDPELAKRIEDGLERMLKDGSFDLIFYKHNGQSIKQARMDKRRIIELKNPDLPPETPLNDKRLWFRP